MKRLSLVLLIVVAMASLYSSTANAQIRRETPPDPGTTSTLTFLGVGSGSTPDDAILDAMIDADISYGDGMVAFENRNCVVLNITTVYDGLLDLVQLPTVYPPDGGDPIVTWHAIWKVQVDVFHWDPYH